MSNSIALRPAEHFQFSPQLEREPESPDGVRIYPLTAIGMTVLRVMDKVRMETIAERTGYYPRDLEEILGQRVIGNTAIMTRNDFEQTIEPFICPEMPALLAEEPFSPPCKRLAIH